MRAVFDDNLITGNDMIDSQHKELIDKINDLLIACEEDKGTDEVLKMLAYLKDYTNFHFSAEEKFQEEIDYPGLKEHQQKHAEFVATVDRLEETAKAGITPEFTELVQKEVIDWLYYHIQGFDRSVAEYRFLRESLM